MYCPRYTIFFYFWAFCPPPPSGASCHVISWLKKVRINGPMVNMDWIHGKKNGCNSCTVSTLPNFWMTTPINPIHKPWCKVWWIAWWTAYGEIKMCACMRTPIRYVMHEQAKAVKKCYHDVVKMSLLVTCEFNLVGTQQHEFGPQCKGWHRTKRGAQPKAEICTIRHQEGRNSHQFIKPSASPVPILAIYGLCQPQHLVAAERFTFPHLNMWKMP